MLTNHVKYISTVVKAARMLDSKPSLSKYDFTILKNVWALEPKYARFLNYRATFFTPVSSFLAKIDPEAYPKTYEDKITLDGKTYYISYVFTSGTYLEDLADHSPHTMVAYQLRVNEGVGFKYCLVRKWDRRWSREYLLANGAVEVK